MEYSHILQLFTRSKKFAIHKTISFAGGVRVFPVQFSVLVIFVASQMHEPETLRI